MSSSTQHQGLKRSGARYTHSSSSIPHYLQSSPSILHYLPLSLLISPYLSFTLFFYPLQGLSPFFLGPIPMYGGLEAKNMENAWQFSKVYTLYLLSTFSLSSFLFSFCSSCSSHLISFMSLHLCLDSLVA